jgi:hypothetical protein
MKRRNKLGMSKKKDFCVVLGLRIECSYNEVSGMCLIE